MFMSAALGVLVVALFLGGGSVAPTAQSLKDKIQDGRAICSILRALSIVKETAISAYCYVGSPLSGDGVVIQAASLVGGKIDKTVFEVAMGQYPPTMANGLITAKYYQKYDGWSALKLASYSFFRPDFASKAKIENFHAANWSDPEWAIDAVAYLSAGNARIAVKSVDGGLLVLDASSQFYARMFAESNQTALKTLSTEMAGVITGQDIKIGREPATEIISYGKQSGFALLTDMDRQ